MVAAITMKASVALRLPGAMQLMQVPTIDGASYTATFPSLSTGTFPLNGLQARGVNPLLRAEVAAKGWVDGPRTQDDGH